MKSRQLAKLKPVDTVKVLRLVTLAQAYSGAARRVAATPTVEARRDLLDAEVRLLELAQTLPSEETVSRTPPKYRPRKRS